MYLWILTVHFLIDLLKQGDCDFRLLRTFKNLFANDLLREMVGYLWKILLEQFVFSRKKKKQSTKLYGFGLPELEYDTAYLN